MSDFVKRVVSNFGKGKAVCAFLLDISSLFIAIRDQYCKITKNAIVLSQKLFVFGVTLSLKYS